MVTTTAGSVKYGSDWALGAIALVVLVGMVLWMALVGVS
jgi:hypothetical protein